MTNHLSGSKVSGDMHVQKPSSTNYGSGSLSVYNRLDLSHEYQEGYVSAMRSMFNSLQVSAALGLNAAAEKGNLVLSSTHADTKDGTIKVQATDQNGALHVSVGGGGFLAAANGPVHLTGKNAVITTTEGSVEVKSAGVVDVSAPEELRVKCGDDTFEVGLGRSTLSTATLKLSSTGDTDVVSGSNLNLRSADLQLNATSSLNLKGTNVNIDGEVVVNGNLLVNGVTTTVDTQNMVVKDNIIEINADPRVGSLAGIAIHRHAGTVAATDPEAVYTIASWSDNSCTLLEDLSVEDGDDLVGAMVRIGEPADEVVLTVSAFTHETRTLEFTTSSGVSVPEGSKVRVFRKLLAGMHFAESRNAFCFSYGRPGDKGFCRDGSFAPVLAKSLVVQESIKAPDFQTVPVTLKPSGFTGVPAMSGKRGSFMVLVQSERPDGAAATFMVSKSSSDLLECQRFRMTSSLGPLGEEIELSWAGEGVLSLGLDAPDDVDTSLLALEYNVKFIGV